MSDELSPAQNEDPIPASPPPESSEPEPTPRPVLHEMHRAILLRLLPTKRFEDLVIDVEAITSIIGTRDWMQCATFNRCTFPNPRGAQIVTGAHFAECSFEGGSLIGWFLCNAQMHDCNLSVKDKSSTRLPCAATMLSLNWRSVYAEDLIHDLMRWDRMNHHEPDSFDQWAPEEVPQEAIDEAVESEANERREEVRSALEESVAEAIQDVAGRYGVDIESDSLDRSIQNIVRDLDSEDLVDVDSIEVEHPDGPCPYSGINYERATEFGQDAEIWRNSEDDGDVRPYDLMMALFKDQNIVWSPVD